MFNAKQYKKEQVEIWDSLAGSYDQSFSALMVPAVQQMIDEVALKEGDSVVDLASGTGIDAFVAGASLGANGKVVGVDISPKMVALANEKAQARGAKNVSFVEMDAEKLEFKDATYDAAFSKWGLTFFPNCNRALKEVLRVLKPGGRFSAMVFGRPEGTQFLTVAARAAAKHLMSGVVASEGGPTDFQFAAEGALESALNGAGFMNVRARRFAVMIGCESSEVYWKLLIAGTGRLSYHLNHASPETQQAIIREVRNQIERYKGKDGIRLPIEVVIGYGEKAKKGSSEHVNSPTRSMDELLAEASEGVKRLSVAEAARLVTNRETLVVDVRPRMDFVGGHIPHSISVPRGRLEAAASTVISDGRSKVLVSGDGPGAVFAARALIELGCKDVSIIEGGFSAWSAAGLSVTQ